MMDANSNLRNRLGGETIGLCHSHDEGVDTVLGLLQNAS